VVVLVDSVRHDVKLPDETKQLRIFQRMLNAFLNYNG